jgi:hypothetical protein
MHDRLRPARRSHLHRAPAHRQKEPRGHVDVDHAVRSVRFDEADADVVFLGFEDAGADDAVVVEVQGEVVRAEGYRFFFAARSDR